MRRFFRRRGGVDYTTEHPDLYHVPTEEEVPNEAKVLPTDKYRVMAMTAFALVLGLAGLLVAFPLDAELVGLLLCIGALVIAVIAAAMARGDARASMAGPVLAIAFAGVLTALVALDLVEADDRVERLGQTIDPVRRAEQVQGDRTDDAAVPAAATVEAEPQTAGERSTPATD